LFLGKSNCPYFAKAELIGDQLARNLPDFRVHKIVKDSNEWDVIMILTLSIFYLIINQHLDYFFVLELVKRFMR
jgi:hypothetical protein